MIRAISIVLIAAIALHTIGCTTTRPLARANEVSEENNQTSMREQALGKLKEGMRVRIRIRAGTHAPITGRAIECVVEKIGETSLTVTPVTFYLRNTEKKPFTLPYTDIVGIEYRDTNDLAIFGGGVAVGTILAIFVIGLSLF